MASDPHIKAIVKLMEACRYRHDLYTVFSDCISCMALAISNAVDFAQSKARE
ncbi:restriction endonuclease subunit M, partial [Xanthomonas euvesicatoria]